MWSIIVIIIVLYFRPLHPSHSNEYKKFARYEWNLVINLVGIVDEQKVLSVESKAAKIQFLKMESGWFWFLSLLLPTDFHRFASPFEIWSKMERSEGISILKYFIIHNEMRYINLFIFFEFLRHSRARKNSSRLFLLIS